jgi:hypothetical protein
MLNHPCNESNCRSEPWNVSLPACITATFVILSMRWSGRGFIELEHAELHGIRCSRGGGEFEVPRRLGLGRMFDGHVYQLRIFSSCDSSRRRLVRPQ